ncbi:styrene monooxygenase/indole monooxygenase family protein [Streptomyces sp. SP18CS02]|uniref:styrene monooxygenase/indole monooxygenase family protein n=1 Tax=Streptomyces sp. SP18CS02 TaxID=3002531 RepID=UPI002E790A67|nr:styrene monooxygenase/indole monooxygenase family protein [Streptomyces sp. SP18CS02]MEE1757285.1 hypothetical protein [Streptomyces sp. SP18CS02]
MPNIAIVGAGISGLHLALRLQQLGVSTTLYAERSVEELAAGRPSNLVVRFGRTRERERSLGVAHWEEPGLDTHGVNIAADIDPAVGFFGRLQQPGQGVDFRIYLPRLISDYLDRGGSMELIAPEVSVIDRLARRHDLVVVATGRRAFGELFPRDAARSPYSEPQRLLAAGLFRGIAPSDPPWIHFQLVPEAGEIFSTRLLSFDGPVHGMVIEAIPGGPLEQMTYLHYNEDPAGFERTLLKLLADYAPPLRERIDESEFGLTRPLDLLQGGITPTVRKGWAELSGGRYALALGDAWIVNDPLAGQGANLGSRNAFDMAELIAGGEQFDEAFCRRVESELWKVAGPVVAWSNMNVGPPQPHLLEVMMAATEDNRVGDAFVDNFNDPWAMWEAMRTPENTASWIKGIKAGS